MKFDPLKWTEIALDEDFQAKGRLQLRASSPVCVYVSAQGVEGLASVGNETDILVPQDAVVRVTSKDADARVFLYDPHRKSYAVSGVVYTNIDRRPLESGQLLEVRRAVRQAKLELLGARQEMRRELQEEARRQNQAFRERTRDKDELEDEPDKVEAELEDGKAPVKGVQPDPVEKDPTDPAVS